MKRNKKIIIPLLSMLALSTLTVSSIALVTSCATNKDDPPLPSPEEALELEKQRWEQLNTTIEITQSELDELKNNDWQRLEIILFDSNLLDNDQFAYSSDDIVVNEANKEVSFTLLIEDEFGGSISVKATLRYTVNQETTQESILQDAVNELNQINWNDFNYAKLKQNRMRFININNNANVPEYYILKYINNFDDNQFVKKYNDKIKMDIKDENFSSNIFSQTIRFKITVIQKDNQASLDTNEIVVNFKYPSDWLSSLDADENTDPDVRVTNSCKGILPILHPLEPLTESIFKDRYRKFFTSNKNNKLYEMLYFARFILYQTFGDNASSIDYGTLDNGVILKAKIKETKTINEPYINFVDDENHTIQPFNLKTGEIITIKLTLSNPNDEWEPIGNDANIGFDEKYFYYEKGMERNQKNTTDKKLISFGQSWKNGNIHIQKNSQSLLTKNYNFRATFCFSIPCKKR